MKRKLTCHCGAEIESDFPEEIDLSQEPRTIDEILDGTFMSVRCTSCGALLKPEFATVLHGSDRGWNITFIPELERTGYLTGKREVKTNRLVIGFRELREKAVMLREGLDDRPIEILKFYLLEKLEEPDEMSISLFEVSEDENLVFHIEGKGEELGLTKMPMRMYEKVFDELEERIKEEPFFSIVAEPYVSINKICLEEDEK